jgi:hypothetical protein
VFEAIAQDESTASCFRNMLPPMPECKLYVLNRATIVALEKAIATRGVVPTGDPGGSLAGVLGWQGADAHITAIANLCNLSSNPDEAFCHVVGHDFVRRVANE